MKVEKNAVVLGSSRGVGKAIAEALRREGFDAPELSRADIDTSFPESVDHFVSKRGPTDVFVFNTGGPPKWAFKDLERRDWERYHQQLFLSFVTMLRMIEVRDGGYIFLVNSHLITEPRPDMALSCAYRTAAWSLLKSLSKQYAARGVSCINLALGPILTERLRQLTPDVPALENRLPMQRAGRPEEVGELVRSIVAGNIKYLSGISITVDGALGNSLFS